MHPDYVGREEYFREFFQKNKERIMAYRKNYYQEHRQLYSDRARLRNQDLKIEVLTHYSNGIPTCSCCNENTMEFLTMDHVDGVKPNGAPRSGSQLYGWLRKHNWPSGFRVLCFNCNWALGHFGHCPHQRAKERRGLT